MNLKTREIKHLTLGATPDNIQGINLISYRIICNEDAWNTLESVKQILIFINTAGLGFDSIIPEFPPDPKNIWTEALRTQIYDEILQWLPTKLKQKVASSELIYAVQCLTGTRDWLWWDADILTETEMMVQLEIYGWPVSGIDAFKWLFIQFGANQIELVKNIK
jgi:hypothetical protein